MKLHKKSLWTLLVLLGALLASTALIALRPEPKPRAVEEVLPLVGVVLAQPAAERMLVRAQGTLAPRDEIELVAEAAGRVVWVSPSYSVTPALSATSWLALAKVAVASGPSAPKCSVVCMLD